MKLYRITFQPRGLECYVVEDELTHAVGRAFSSLSAGDTALVKGLVAEILKSDMDHVILNALDRERKIEYVTRTPGGMIDRTDIADMIAKTNADVMLLQGIVRGQDKRIEELEIKFYELERSNELDAYHKGETG